MEPLTWGFIGTLIGTVVGASASIFTTYINAKNSSKIQKEIQNYTRNEKFRNFQRSNYLKLQDTIPRSIRLITLLHFEDLKNYKRTGEWQKTLLNSENDHNLMIAIRHLSIQTERVENETLRKKLKKLRKKLTEVNNTESKLESENIMLELANNDIEQIMEEIGTELRKHY